MLTLRLMLYTWLAVCTDTSEAIVTWMGVHVIIDHNYLCISDTISP